MIPPMPKGQCPQCWAHAYDRSIHARLAPREDCQPCIACKTAGHPPMKNA